MYSGRCIKESQHVMTSGYSMCRSHLEGIMRRDEGRECMKSKVLLWDVTSFATVRQIHSVEMIRARCEGEWKKVLLSQVLRE